MVGAKIEGFGFRDLYHQYLLVVADEGWLRTFAPEFQRIEGDNALLVYGYVDHHAGMTFEILCYAKRYPNGATELRPGNGKVSSKIRYDGVRGQMIPIDYDVKMEEFRDKITIVNEGYRTSDDMEAIRNYKKLDESRNPQFPDDILVYLVVPEVKLEKIWVRTEKVVDGHVAGTLLNQPHSELSGLNMGDLVKILSVEGNSGPVLVIDIPQLYK